MCHFYEADVNVREGFFITAKLAENRGTTHPLTNYQTITLKHKNQKYKTDLLHRCIWKEANKIEIPPGFVVHHINGDKSNNKISNLALCSQFYNIKESKPKQLCETKTRAGIAQREKHKTGKNHRCSIIAKCDTDETTYNSMRQCSKALDISLSLISNIVNKKKYCHTSRSKKDGKRYTFLRSSK